MVMAIVRPPPLPSQIESLQRILDLIEAHGADSHTPPLVVFDLDGTLVDNRARTIRIFREYADEVRGEFPDVADALDTLDEESLQYLLSETLKSVGLSHVDVVRDITGYWQERFFADDYCQFDTPLDGAVEFVNACHDLGAVVVYMTGRDKPNMLLGTVASLRDAGLPMGVAGVELILKPDATLGEEAFKRNALPTLGRLGDIVALFDNEPANCNMAKRLFPDAEVVLLETQKVPGAPESADGVHHIADFRLE